MIRRFTALCALALTMGFDVEAQTPATNTPAIIDVHLHAMAADAFGPPPIPACAAELTFLPRNPKEEYGFDQFASCVSPLKSPMTDDELMRRTLQLLELAGVESADFLTARQKRDIFYNNAARFLRLSSSPGGK